MDFVSPIATEIKTQKTPEKAQNSVFRKNGGENYFRFREKIGKYVVLRKSQRMDDKPPLNRA